jgi:hypothetical protein
VTPSWVAPVLSVVDGDELVESGALADVLAFGLDFALADDDGLFAGLPEDLVAVAVDPWPRAGAELWQLGLAVGWTLFFAGPVEVELELELALGLVVGEAGGVVVGVLPGLTLGLALSLGFGLVLWLADGFGLVLWLADGPGLVLWLGDVAGGVVLCVVLVGELELLTATDACVGGGDGHALRAEGDGITRMLFDGAPSPGVAVGEIVPWPSVAPALLDELLALGMKAEPMASLKCTIAWRAGGTTDRTRPTANTAAPTAKAGRSIASRQSRRCRVPLRPSGWLSRPISLLAASEMAGHVPRIPLRWRAWAPRDRILSRIRSKPSEPGST